MINELFCFPAVWTRLRRGPLGEHIDGFCRALVRQGYVPLTVQRKVRLVAHLSEWLARRHVSVNELNEEKLDAFARHRSRHAYFSSRADTPTLRQILQYLRDEKVVPCVPARKSNGAFHGIEAKFREYLEKERGLSLSATTNYVRTARRFLTERYGNDPVDCAQLQACDVTGYVLRHAHDLSPGSASLMVQALRHFCRFLHRSGETASNLASSVPPVANWKLTGLPKFLKPEQVETILETCDRSTSLGQRDYAVLLLLARLGLRAGELVNLTLDDVRWDSAEIVVRGKSQREDVLPLPQDVGEALVVYLQNSRPRCTSRSVFIRMKAPHRGLRDSTTICDTVKRAMSRAGLHAAYRGGHVLRHSLATQMLRGGASLSEIGQILRHQSIGATEIYAKVDLAALHTLALPWPGGDRT